MKITDFCGEEEVHLPFTTYEELLLRRMAEKYGRSVKDYLKHAVRPADAEKGVTGAEMCERIRQKWRSVFPMVEAVNTVEEMAYTANFIFKKSYPTGKYMDSDQMLDAQGIQSFLGHAECPVAPRLYVTLRGTPYFLVDGEDGRPRPVPIGPSDLTEEEWAWEVEARLLILARERGEDRGTIPQFLRLLRRYVEDEEVNPPAQEPDEDQLVDYYYPDGMK